MKYKYSKIIGLVILAFGILLSCFILNEYRPKLVMGELVTKSTIHGEVWTDFGHGRTFYGVKQGPVLGDVIWGISVRQTQFSKCYVEPSYYRTLAFFIVTDHKKLEKIYRMVHDNVISASFDSGKTKIDFEDENTVVLKYDWVCLENCEVRLGYFVSEFGGYEENEVDFASWTEKSGGFENG